MPDYSNFFTQCQERNFLEENPLNAVENISSWDDHSAELQTAEREKVKIWESAEVGKFHRHDANLLTLYTVYPSTPPNVFYLLPGACVAIANPNYLKIFENICMYISQVVVHVLHEMLIRTWCYINFINLYTTHTITPYTHICT